MKTVNSKLIALVVRQTQLIAKLDKELYTYKVNCEDINKLTLRIVTADTNISIINNVSFH